MRNTKALVAGALLATILTLVIPGFASAKSVLAELRVEGPGLTLDPGTWYVTGPERVRKSSPADVCERTGGTVQIPGPTPLSLVGSGEDSNPALSQVRVRRDETGLFVCEIGSILGRTFSDPSGFAGWTYYQGFVFGSAAADQLALKAEDQILWVFSDFGDATPANTGDVLEMKGVPSRSDGTFTLRVVGHRFDGTTNPALGATIEGAESVKSLGEGRYQVTVSPGHSTLRATHGLDVPSNQVETCFQEVISECPRAHGRTIVGSGDDDRLEGTRGFDEISAGAGRDTIDLLKGGVDTVDCGRGADKVLVEQGDVDDELAASCEKLKTS